MLSNLFLNPSGYRSVPNPFSSGSRTVNLLCDRLLPDLDFGVQKDFSKATTNKVLRMVDELERKLVVCAKRGHVAVLSDNHMSLRYIRPNQLPTAAAMLSTDMEFDFINSVERRNFVYGLDELKIIYVSLLRQFGFNAFLLEFVMHPLRNECTPWESESVNVTPYLPIYPFSQLHHNSRLGIGIFVPSSSERPEQFSELYSFSPLRDHPHSEKLIVLNDFESSGVLFGLRAERRLNRLKLLVNGTVEINTHDDISNELGGILLDIREAYFRYPRNSVALVSLVKTMAFVSSLIEQGLLNPLIIFDSSLKFGLWEDITLRFCRVPGEFNSMRESIREQGLRKELLLGKSDLPDLEAAFILGLCLEDTKNEGNVGREDQA